MKNRVVVTGMGILTALGRGLSITEQALREGRSGISEITSFDVSAHKTSLGAEVKDSFMEVDCIKDRASSMVLAACQDAFMSAAIHTSNGYSIKAPVILGTTLGGMLSGQQYHRDLIFDKNKDKRAELLKDYFSCNQAAHVINKFGLLGEALILHNACASGLSAIGCAFHRIKFGDTSIAVTGGYDVFSDFTHAGFNALQLVAPERCCPFDKNRSGLILGEGAGILILEELDHALARGAHIFVEIIGYGQSSDAYHITKPDPTAKGAICAILMALKDAGISPAEIDYINAHGTGTKLNDPMEAMAINVALGNHGSKIPLSSVKPMIGHTLGAAGAVEAIISTISINSSIAPENLNYNTPDPECKLNVIFGASKCMNIKTVLSNSFGFGGSNSVVILKKYCRSNIE